MSGNDIQVKETEIGGNFTGRDTYQITNNSTYQLSQFLETLYRNYESEMAGDRSLKEFCEELNYYNSQNGNEEIIGLENKLIAGKRDSFIWYAKDVKERYHKKLLHTCQYSTIAQEVHIHLLAKVRTSFMLEVYTLVCAGAADQVINSVIHEKVVKPLHAELGVNAFRFSTDDIMGMIFFLTGNCHIKWTE